MTNSQNFLSPLESFILNGKSFLYRDILEGNIDPDDKSEFEHGALTFINSWLSGKTNFQLKTSGSTGRPKLISRTKEQMQKSALRTIATFNLKAGQTTLVCLNTNLVAGMMMLVRAIEGKLNLIIESPKVNPLVTIKDGKIIHFCAMTPNQVETVLDETPVKLAQIKTLLIGGAALSPTLAKRLQHVDTSVFHSYAMTETLTHVGLRKVNGLEKSDNYYAMEGVSFSQDKRKCLIIHDRVLEIDQLITNDIVDLIDEKSFRWIGRTDHVINTGGIKIQIEKVEIDIKRILHTIGIDFPFCLLSIPDKKLINKMILLIEHNEKRLNESNILMELKSKLPKYHDPKALKQIPELILTKSGKIDRNRNAKLYLRN